MALSMRSQLVGTLVALTATIAVLSFFVARAGQETLDSYESLERRAVAPAYHLSAFARALVRNRLLLARLLGDPTDAEASRWRGDLLSERAAIEQSAEAMRAMLADNPEIAPTVRTLDEALRVLWDAETRTLALIDAKRLPEARKVNDSEVRVIGQRLRVSVDGEIENLNQRTKASLQQWHAVHERRRMALTVTLMLVLGGAVWAGWRLQRAIMVPTRRMRDTLGALGNGDLGARVSPFRDDELGALAQAINRAGEQLSEAAERDRAAATQQRESAERETQEAEALRGGVDHLLLVTAAAAQGDLSLRCGPLKGEEMQRLGQSVEGMIDGLRQLVGDLQTSVLTIRGAVNDLNAAVHDNESTLAEQAASSTEVAATSTEMAQNANELAATMQRVNETNTGALQRAEQGRESLQRLDRTIEQILAATADISGALGAIAGKSTDITTVVTTITRVADQTNLLSLNAAIEAEKAGEHGQGFSVIASEIRRLSDQTTDAASHIEQIVREMHSAISTSVMSMDRFNDQVRRNVDDVGTLRGVLAGVIDSVEALAPRVESASESTRAQAEGATQINEAIRQIHDSITHAHRAARSTGEAGEALGRVAHQLQTGIGRFRLN